jgi:uncharacterized DUF497 family protein
MGETEDFEWDDTKDAFNIAKHGLPLRFAVLLFDDPHLVNLRPRVTESGETRHIAVGKVEGRVFACVYTIRGKRRRLISLRAASRSERRVYDAQVDKGRN